MKQEPYEMDEVSRGLELGAMVEVAAHRAWTLLAAHVRTNHVHVVLETVVAPELAMNAFKGYASRRLNESGMGTRDQKRWARHGSTRWLWSDDQVGEAIRYVVEGQGPAMAVYCGEGS